VACLLQLASERGQREQNQLAERHQKMLRELHEANAAASALKADNAEKTKQLSLKEDALKSAHSDVAKVHSFLPVVMLLEVMTHPGLTERWPGVSVPLRCPASRGSRGVSVSRTRCIAFLQLIFTDAALFADCEALPSMIAAHYTNEKPRISQIVSNRALSVCRSAVKRRRL